MEPEESRALVGQPAAMHGLVGIGAGMPLPLVERLAPGQEWKEGPRGVIDEFAVGLAWPHIDLCIIHYSIDALNFD